MSNPLGCNLVAPIKGKTDYIYRPGRDNDPLGPNGVKKVGYLVKKFAPASWAGKVQMRVTHIVLKD